MHQLRQFFVEEKLNHIFRLLRTLSLTLGDVTDMTTETSTVYSLRQTHLKISLKTLMDHRNFFVHFAIRKIITKPA